MTLEPSSPAPGAVTLLSRVEWVDTDAAGHHHNSSIMRWVEAAEAEMMRRAQLPEYFPRAPRVHQSISFHSKLTFEQTVRTQLWIDRIGRTSLRFGFTIAGNGPGDSDEWIPAASGQLVTAHVPPHAEGSAPWPEDWRIALTPFCPAPADDDGASATTEDGAR